MASPIITSMRAAYESAYAAAWVKITPITVHVGEYPAGLDDYAAAVNIGNLSTAKAISRAAQLGAICGHNCAKDVAENRVPPSMDGQDHPLSKEARNG